jgi:type IV pilus assembly protein PilA
MLRKLRDKKGFTLIELMIVVAIIAILAAIAIPNFLKFQAKSKQSEARTMLTGIYEAEMAYFATENVFHTSATEVGFEPASDPKFYTAWGIVDASDYGFTATAHGNIDRDPAHDRWYEYECSREPYNVWNDVGDIDRTGWIQTPGNPKVCQ